MLKRLGLNRRARLAPLETVRRIKGHHRRKRSRHLGYDYVHVAIDDHSRVAYVEVLGDEKGDTCARFLARATQWMGGRGVAVRHVMTDNVLYREDLAA